MTFPINHGECAICLRPIIQQSALDRDSTPEVINHTDIAHRACVERALHDGSAVRIPRAYERFQGRGAVRKELEYLHDMAAKTIDVPAGSIAVVQENDGIVHIAPCPGFRRAAREPFQITVDGFQHSAVLAPGDVVVVDVPATFDIPEGMSGSAHRRIAIENRDGIGHEALIGRYVFDGSGWVGSWAAQEEWIDEDGARVAAPAYPEGARALDYVHDHAVKRVQLPPGHYLISQRGCYHPDIYPDPSSIGMNPSAYWKDGGPEDSIVDFGTRVAVLAPGDEIIVRSDRTLVGYVRPEHYREELFRNVNGRIECIVLQQYVVRE